MKLRSLAVEHFRCIRKARVEFCPGLNVLYGPNDLGKSSLAEAVRAALLLPVSARYSDDFLNWHGSGEPSVELVFETEAQRIWRVRKSFGSGAQAFLDESRDGADFQVEARGRDVEGKLRDILRWGLAPPGGKGGQKGMPFTFLSTALLAQQDRVAAIFDQALSQDGDASGKQRLIEALQAAAEDPTFKRVLDRVQSFVDLAFTATGRKKTGKNSPWIQLRDQIARAEEYARHCGEQSQKTTAIEIELQELHLRQAQRRSAVEEAEALLSDIETSHSRGRQRAEIQTRLDEQQSKVNEIDLELQQLAGAEELHCKLIAEVEAATKETQSTQAARDEAAKQVAAAKDEVARLESADKARERQLRQAAFEKQQADLRTEQVRNQAAIAQLRAVESADTQSRQLAQTVKDFEQRHQKALEAVRQSEDQERALTGIGQILRSQAARRAMEEAEAALSQTNAWRAEAGQRRADAAALEAAQPAVPLPSPAQIDDLKRLDTDLRIAQAKVTVGLNLSIQPKRKQLISIRRDGQPPTSHELKDAVFETSAEGRLELDLAGVAAITVFGGARNAREAVDRLEARWAAEAEPVLAAAGVASLEDLARLSAEAAQRARQIHEARNAAAQLEQRIADQPDWSGLRTQRERDLAAAEQALDAVDRPALEKLARKLAIAKPADADSQLEQLRAKRAGLNTAERQLEGEWRAAAARAGQCRQELDTAQSRVPGDWRQLLPAHLEKQAAVEADLASIQSALQTLATGTGKAIAAAHKNLAAAEGRHREAEDRHKLAAEQLRAQEKRQAISEGELKMRREAAAKLDLAGARQAADRVRAELDAVPQPLYQIDDEMLADARRQVEAARQDLREIEDAIQAKRGALEHVGGEVAKQRTADAQDALHRAREKEHAMEIDYEAWQLLRDTLHEAERAEGTHLGRALADPIGKRFAGLTGRRYGEMSLGPDLETHTIAAAGDGRSVFSLSVGTRDQLSTIFRLSLAEQLRSAVLLDDQLTQSDAARMEWLRTCIRELAATIQIVVFTCRPEDYLLPGELKSAKKSDPLVRSVNLAQAIERSA